MSAEAALHTEAGRAAVRNAFHDNYLALIADRIRHGLPVRFGEEYYRKPDTGYVMVMLKVRKNREKDFLSSMEELKRKMILLGHTDYEEFCDNLWRGLGFKDEDAMALS